MLKLIIFSVLAFVAGMGAGYFIYQIRFKRKLGLFEARETALGHREAETDRIRLALPRPESTGNREVSVLQATIESLQEEVEQQSMAQSFAAEEYQLELDVLRNEISSFRSGTNTASNVRVEIEDAEYENQPPQPVEIERDYDASVSEEPSASVPAEETREANAFEVLEPEVEDVNAKDDSETESVESIPSEESIPTGESIPSEESFQSDSSPPASVAEEALDWANSVYSYLFGDLIATFSETAEKESSTSEADSEDDRDANATSSGDSSPPPEETTEESTEETIEEIIDENIEESSFYSHRQRYTESAETIDPPSENAAPYEPTYEWETVASEDPDTRNGTSYPDTSASSESSSSYPRFQPLVELSALNWTEENDVAVDVKNPITAPAARAGLQVLLGLPDDQFRTLRQMGFRSYEDIAQLSTPEIYRIADSFDIPASRIEKIWISGAQLRLYEGP